MSQMQETKIGVLGGGQMGAGIAHAFLMAGYEVFVGEVNDESASRALDRVLSHAQKSISKGVSSFDFETLSKRLTASSELEGFSDVKLCIEAVPEDLELKKEALQKLEKVLPQDAILASNTSSISVDELATFLSRPENFLGLHFFNPVPVSELVEIVNGRYTDAERLKEAEELISTINKTGVVVNNFPGFASSRLGVMLGIEAIRMVEEGVGSAENIDKIIMLGYKHPIGPLKLTDLVGLDVRLGISRYLEEHLGERFAAPQLLVDMVEKGELGKKTGKGFYDW